jgi:hypothetical protein
MDRPMERIVGTRLTRDDDARGDARWDRRGAHLIAPLVMPAMNCFDSSM